MWKYKSHTSTQYERSADPDDEYQDYESQQETEKEDGSFLACGRGRRSLGGDDFCFLSRAKKRMPACGYLVSDLSNEARKAHDGVEIRKYLFVFLRCETPLIRRGVIFVRAKIGKGYQIKNQESRPKDFCL